MDMKAVELTDGVVTLRAHDVEHVDGLFEAGRESIAEVGPWLIWCHPGYSIEDARGWSRMRREAWETGEEFIFAVLDAKSSRSGACSKSS